MPLFEHKFEYAGVMSITPLATAHRLLAEAVEVLSTAAGPGAGDEELLSVLTLCEGVSRRLDRVSVATITALGRRGVFTERGYKTMAAGLSDLVGWERFEARRRVVAAEQVVPRVGLDGSVLPARLPHTAAVFAAGQASLRHVDAVATVLSSAGGRPAGAGRAGRSRRTAGRQDR